MVYLVLLASDYTVPLINLFFSNFKYNVGYHSEWHMSVKWCFVLVKNIAVMLHLYAM
jgi:hypothetical protein